MASETATTTSSSGERAPASSTATPSISVLTLTEKALTTTFTPPASCGEMHLTQLSSPGYQIWLNEPQPVPNSKFGDCYPPGYIAGYTSGQYGIRIHNSSSSIAPVFSPLVCPQGWNAVRTWENGYIACCASGFLLHAPDTTVDSNRPAYGGTCYSNFQVGQTVKITAYDSASVTATIDWVASATNDQAYAHPIDGFQLSSDDNSSSSGLTGGQIAGIVVGCIGGLIAILLAVLFLIQRRHRKKRQLPLDNPNQAQHQQQQQDVQQEPWIKEPLGSPSTGYMQSTYDSPPVAYSSTSPSYTATQHYELESQTPRELDSGWAGGELESPMHKKK